MYIHINKYIYIYTHICIYTHIYACRNTCIQVYMYIDIYVHIYTYIHTRSHTCADLVGVCVCLEGEKIQYIMCVLHFLAFTIVCVAGDRLSGG